MAIPVELLYSLLECFCNVPADGSLDCFAVPCAILPEERDAVVPLAGGRVGTAAGALLLHRVGVPPARVKEDGGVENQLSRTVCTPQTRSIVLERLVGDLVEADESGGRRVFQHLSHTGEDGVVVRGDGERLGVHFDFWSVWVEPIFGDVSHNWASP